MISPSPRSACLASGRSGLGTSSLPGWLALTYLMRIFILRINWDLAAKRLCKWEMDANRIIIIDSLYLCFDLSPNWALNCITFKVPETQCLIVWAYCPVMKQHEAGLAAQESACLTHEEMSHLGCEAFQWLPRWHILHPRKSGMGHSWTDSGMRRARTSYKQMAQGLGQARGCFHFFYVLVLKGSAGIAERPFLWRSYPLGSIHFHTPMDSFTPGLHASQHTYSSRGWVGIPLYSYLLSHPRNKRRGSLRTTSPSDWPALQDFVQILPHETVVPHFDLVVLRWQGMGNLAPLGLSLSLWGRQKQPYSFSLE